MLAALFKSGPMRFRISWISSLCSGVRDSPVRKALSRATPDLFLSIKAPASSSSSFLSAEDNSPAFLRTLSMFESLGQIHLPDFPAPDFHFHSPQISPVDDILLEEAGEFLLVLPQ